MTSIFTKPRPGYVRHIGRCTIIRDLDDPRDAKPPAWVPGLDDEDWHDAGEYDPGPPKPAPVGDYEDRLLADGWEWNGYLWRKTLRPPSVITDMWLGEPPTSPRVQTITNPEASA